MISLKIEALKFRELNRPRQLVGYIVLFCATAGCSTAKPAAHELPELYLKNVGTRTVWLRLHPDEGRMALPPGQDVVLKFSPGESLEIAAKHDGFAEKDVALEGKPSDRIYAEVALAERDLGEDDLITFRIVPQK